MAARKVLVGFAVLALGVGITASVATAFSPCGHRACSDEVAASALSGQARGACIKQVIADCRAGLCSCTGGSPPCSCVCGDGLCGPCEDCGTCPQDCGPCCGNGMCEPARGEDCGTCAADCGTCCGNGTCELDRGENCSTCPGDCGTCPSPLPCCQYSAPAFGAPMFFQCEYTLGGCRFGGLLRPGSRCDANTGLCLGNYPLVGGNCCAGIFLGPETADCTAGSGVSGLYCFEGGGTFSYPAICSPDNSLNESCLPTPACLPAGSPCPSPFPVQCCGGELSCNNGKCDL